MLVWQHIAKRRSCPCPAPLFPTLTVGSRISSSLPSGPHSSASSPTSSTVRNAQRADDRRDSVPPASGLAGGEWWLAEHACAHAAPVGDARAARVGGEASSMGTSDPKPSSSMASMGSGGGGRRSDPLALRGGQGEARGELGIGLGRRSRIGTAAAGRSSTATRRRP